VIVSFESLVPGRLEADEERALLERSSFAVTFATGGRTIRVRFSDRAVGEHFAYRYGDMLAGEGAEPAKRFSVIGDGTRTVFWSSRDDVRIWPRPELPVPVASFLTDGAVMNDVFVRGTLRGLHAAVVRGRRGVAAIVGDSTAGKTTTAVACARRGLTFYSDERCVLADGLAHPFLRALTLRAGGRRLLAADDVDDTLGIGAKLRAWQGRDEVLVRPSSLFGARAGGDPAPLTDVIAIDGTGERPEIAEVPVHALLPDIARTMWSAELGLDRAAAILRDFAAVRCARLTLGTPDATARAIAARLEG
jgi:hypothetical protein